MPAAAPTDRYLVARPGGDDGGGRLRLIRLATQLARLPVVRDRLASGTLLALDGRGDDPAAGAQDGDRQVEAVTPLLPAVGLG
ncbi:hypothetical protein Aple_060480 [Acrocarpospora pleiomorpha]|uniref:Uncharacterized protein n=1 Tax=Acrocarpospora pleiomorpha TaxID=90975 RepID=A0A5M3XT44_9ACTN|nr:hypothetical protein Aple_060480 [Acrocarpospora pleiomorpha]